MAKRPNRNGSDAILDRVAKLDTEGAQLVQPIARDSEQVLPGSRERFSENLVYNLYLLKQRINDPGLIFEEFTLGSVAKKKAVIAYLEQRANKDLVEEIKKRIQAIRAETVLDISFLERNIEDSNLSPFPQVNAVSKPDVAEAGLFQGRILICLAGSPEALLAPTTFFELMDTAEDAFSRWFVASSFFRIARYIMFLMAASLPGFYIALTSFNPEIIPTRLAVQIIANRVQSPFPVYFETFLMMGVVEAVRMMMARMPSNFGSAIALFAGVALIGAGLYSGIVGPIVIMVVTLTIISSFAIPNYNLRLAVRIIQFFTMIASSFFGIFGYAVSFFFLAVHLVSLKSFGIPYMAPLAPTEGSALKSTILRGNSVAMARDETYQSGEKDKQTMSGGSGVKDKLDPRIMAVVLLVAIIEFELYTVPKGIVKIAGTGSWLSIIIATPLLWLVTYLFICLTRRFPKENYFEFNKKIWGKVPALILAIGYLLYWIFYQVTLTEDIAMVNKILFLPKTPMFVTLIALTLCAALLVRYGIVNIVRYFQLMFPYMLIPLAAIYLIAIPSIRIYNFLPPLSTGLWPVLKGAFVNIGMVQGLEVILFLGPFLKDIKQTIIPALIGVTLVQLNALAQCLIGIGVLGTANVEHTLWPGVDALSVIELPGFPVERFGLLFSIPWLIGSFTTMCLFLYLISYGLLQVCNLKNKKRVINVTSLFLVGLTYLYFSYSMALRAREVLNRLTLFFMAVPLLSLLIAKLRGKGESGND